MILALAALLGGIAVLGFASDQFVVGAARIARLRGISPLIVGVVIIGLGTSSPELLVSILAAIEGEADVAVGNVVGSNLANLTLLMGVGAAIATLATDSRTVYREATLVVVATIAFAFVVQGGGIDRWEGAGLLAAMAVALFLVTREDDHHMTDPTPSGDDRIGVEVVRVLLGLIGTVASAQALLWGALDLADRADLAAGFVGATIIALGTSLPELVTVVQSARRDQPELILGNLLGSNLFNTFAVAGAVGVIDGTGIEDGPVTSVGVIAAVAAAVVTMIAMRTGFRVSRREGIALVVAYVVLVPILL